MVKAVIEYISPNGFIMQGVDRFIFSNHMEAKEFAYAEAARRGLLVKSITLSKEKAA